MHVWLSLFQGCCGWMQDIKFGNHGDWLIVSSLIGRTASEFSFECVAFLGIVESWVVVSWCYVLAVVVVLLI